MINTTRMSLHFKVSAGPSSSLITTPKLIFASFLLIYFIIGLLVNALYLWVTTFRMKQNINTAWLFHLIISNLFFILLLPFLSVYVLMEPHWLFGMFLCKALYFLLSVCLYASVFLITSISLNRYLLVYYPHWYIRRVRLYHISAVCFGLWGLAFLCSSPYLLVRVAKLKDNITVCYNDYSLSGKWENAGGQVKWGIFFFRILVSFLLPAAVTTICHFKILIKIKRVQRGSSTKPYKVIYLFTTFFYACWTIHHIADAMSMERGQLNDGVLRALRIVSACVFSSISPVFYLFITPEFQKEFGKCMRQFNNIISSIAGLI
ncbi:PREDICTED: probable G-protein coupled receptor 33 [Nanorana parkeri]|uniref:probable G-protein coupled receptor 33 n=1 Tax=Nanorana parkeri TaxID=125878 RepID=UPI0008544134|nr:PREDICTED: probable G-protein coupled receptor 33 [Nanorana parkeri]